jgi:hypothetical protein
MRPNTRSRLLSERSEDMDDADDLERWLRFECCEPTTDTTSIAS